MRCGVSSNPTAAQDYWWSLAVSHGLAWLLIVLACWIVPRAWQDKPALAPSRRWRWRDLGRKMSYGSRVKCAAFRKRALDQNAYYWMAARARLKPAHAWVFLGLVAAWWIQGLLRAGRLWTDAEAVITTSVIVNSVFKFWVIIEARQSFGEDRRSGAFELLLATPLTVDDFLRGQILALRRQFLKPLLVVTAVEMAFVLALRRSWSFDAGDTMTCLAGIGMLWADIAALAWVTMAAALACKNLTQATSQAVASDFGSALGFVCHGFLLFESS